MRKTFKLMIVFFVVMCFGSSLEAQELKLNYIYGDWKYKVSKTADDVLIFRSPRAYSSGDKGGYGSTHKFTKGRDPIVYKDHMRTLTSRRGWCGNEKPREKVDYSALEVWTILPEKKQLRHDIYFESEEDQEQEDYSATYNIVVLKRDYMKLKLEKELFYGS